jgi:hypothetical protein
MWDFSKPQLLGDLEDPSSSASPPRAITAAGKPGKPVYDSIDLGQYLQDKAQNQRGLFLLHIRSGASEPPENGGRAPMT